MTENLPVPTNVDAALTALAKRHRAASGLGIQVLNLVGGQAENLLERLPDPVKDRLEEATLAALRTSLAAAEKSRGLVGDQAGWLARAVATAMGAAGGAGGLPTALAELPITTTVLLRAIQAVAREYGFDPSSPEIQAECLKVFASAGPLDSDDGADMAFLAARVSLTGGSVQKILTSVAPRLATVLGQKLAAQTVPVLGAVAGAATNYAYSSFYHEMAQVHFGLLALARDSGTDSVTLTNALRERLQKLPVKKA